MRITGRCVFVLSLFAALGLACSANAQIVPTGPGSSAMGFTDHPLGIQPFGDWNFDPDFQFFSPTINFEYGDEPLEAPYGWFFTYDRQYLNTKRSNSAFDNFMGDFAWGNRFDFGYMTENDNGWMASVSYLRMGDVNLVDLNNFTFTNVEINKTWRLEPFYHGCYLEPFVGVRYFKFNDRLNGYTVNNMIGGQVGGRLFKQVKNFVISGEVRGYAAHNYQLYMTADVTNEEFVSAGEVRAEVAYLITRDVAFRMGWDMLLFGQGVGRGNLPLIENDEDMMITGLTFGFTVNR